MELHKDTQPSNVQVIPSTGVSSSTRASGSKPRSNTKHNRILPAKRKQIWKTQRKLSNNSLNRPSSVWKALSKLFAYVRLSNGGASSVVNEIILRLLVTCGTDHPLVSGLRLFKTRFRGMNGSWLAPSPVPATTYIPPTDKDLEICIAPLFQWNTIVGVKLLQDEFTIDDLKYGDIVPRRLQEGVDE
ncbi:hypothetical protein Tco_0659706 [Tanacetum coccineum]